MGCGRFESATGQEHIDPLAGSTRWAITGASNRVDIVQERENPVDLTMILALGVALLIVLSGYFLFNDVPTLGNSSTRRRR